MTSYIVTDDDLRIAITAAMREQDKNPQGDIYIIENSIDVVNHVLRSLDLFKVAESEQTDTPKQDSRREIDTSEYPVIRLESNELVDMICDAYRNGLAD